MSPLPVLIRDRKAQLRQQMKARRADLNERERARASFYLGENLWSFLQNQAGKTVGIYLARPYEISLDGLISRLHASGMILCAPRVQLEPPLMRFFRFNAHDQTQCGPFGVSEPPGDEELTPEILLVPGLAFDEQGGRLGTGGGWYDRFAPKEALRIGVGFDFQIVPSVPCEESDLKMDFLATDSRFCVCEAPN